LQTATLAIILLFNQWHVHSALSLRMFCRIHFHFPGWAVLGLIIASLLFSCDKDKFVTSPDAAITLSVDSLFFDTVFTGLGSVTRRVTISNPNTRKLRLTQVSLRNQNSVFSLNVNGNAGEVFNDIDLLPNDSIYAFVKVTIDPNAQNQPFVLEDSLELVFNGNRKFLKLKAYGQNARFISGGEISANTTWDNALPYVILQQLDIDTGITLTIGEGTRIYCNARAPIVVNGSLVCRGGISADQRIVFTSDRTDEAYRDLPGTWPGIIFTSSSQQNRLENVTLKNAYQALIAQGQPNASPAKLTLLNCIIENGFDLGLFALNTSVRAENCLFSQIGNDGDPGIGGSNVILIGGNHRFTHCTLATYGNFFQNHKQGVLYVGNNAGGVSLPMNAVFSNCLFYGEGGLAQNEITTVRSGNAPFLADFSHVLYKVKDDPANANFTASIKNQNPLFDTVNISRRLFNFRLKENSPAVNAASASGPSADLDGAPRPSGTGPDIGCYERQ
jgi:hypothetical protein